MIKSKQVKGIPKQKEKKEIKKEEKIRIKRIATCMYVHKKRNFGVAKNPPYIATPPHLGIRKEREKEKKKSKFPMKLGRIGKNI